MLYIYMCVYVYMFYMLELTRSSSIFQKALYRALCHLQVIQVPVHDRYHIVHVQVRYSNNNCLIID